MGQTQGALLKVANLIRQGEKLAITCPEARGDQAQRRWLAA